MTKPEALRHDRSRELILDSLAPSYPTPVDSVVLRRVLGTLGHPLSEDDLNSYIAYLEEKELVRTEKKPGGIILIKITAKGIDALDERITVKGVGQEI